MLTSYELIKITKTKINLLLFAFILRNFCYLQLRMGENNYYYNYLSVVYLLEDNGKAIVK